MKKILTIAGSDPSGGAGIQADLKTITVYGMYGMSAITALTVQNTTGVFSVTEMSPDFVAQQIDCIFEDIRPDAVKIGMVSNAEIIRVIADRLSYHRAENIVADPVMIATSGGRLMQDSAQEALIKSLLPLARIITPNIPEAEVLSGKKISCPEDMRKAAEIIAESLNGDILVKGGHLTESADDLLFSSGAVHWLRAPHIDNKNTHGTGCTLSSAIACGLAEGRSTQDSVIRAKEFITGAIACGLDLGKRLRPAESYVSSVNLIPSCVISFPPCGRIRYFSCGFFQPRVRTKKAKNKKEGKSSDIFSPLLHLLHLTDRSPSGEAVFRFLRSVRIPQTGISLFWNLPSLLIVKFSIPLTAFFPGSASASLFTRSLGDLPDLKSPGLRLRREIFPPPAHSAVSALPLTEIRDSSRESPISELPMTTPKVVTPAFFPSLISETVSPTLRTPRTSLSPRASILRKII